MRGLGVVGEEEDDVDSLNEPMQSIVAVAMVVALRAA